MRATGPRARSRCCSSTGNSCMRSRSPAARRRSSWVRRRLHAAWAFDDHDRALDQLRGVVDELARSHPGAAASLREAMEETLTVTRLGVCDRLKRALASTNPCESMIDTVRRTARHVKRWQNGDMCLRWTAAGMLEAERQFRRVIATPSCP